MIEIFVSGSPAPTSTPTPSLEGIYGESDDVNPSHIHYTKENQPIVVQEEDIVKNNRFKKSFIRDVRSSKRRNP